MRNNIGGPNLPHIPGFPTRPQSTPVNPIQGLQTQQQLPGFQHIHQHHVLQNNDANGQALRMQNMQRETQRLYHEIAMLEQRVRALAPQNIINTPQTTADNPANNQLPAFAGLRTGMGPVPGLPPMQQFPPPFQNFVHQQQRERAAQGLHGVQDTPVPGGPVSGRVSPSVTYTQEGIGPNGQRWHMTVNQTTIPLQPGHHHPHHNHPNGLQGQPHTGPFGNLHMNAQPNPAADIQAIMRHADRLNAHNNAEASAPNAQQTTAGLTVPTPGAQQYHPEASGTSTPLATGNNSNFAPHTAEAQALINMVNNIPRSIEPTVFLLSSPSGPRALVLSNSGTYWTPRQSSRRQSPANVNNHAQDRAAIILPEFRNRPHRPAAERAARRAQRNLQDIAPEPLNVPHGNPGAGALGAQVGPFLWLLVRLAGFIWFFSSGNTSWARFFFINAISLVIIIANTGLLNGVAEQVWGPIRRHFEALIPLAGPDAALVPAANAAPIPQPERQAGENGQANPNLRQRRRNPEPDPAEAAARIIAQRQANQGWFYNQFRRVEHSMLLFLASLVPGVGERHIAARDAEATAAEAERQRRVEAAAAAAEVTATDAEVGTVNGDAGESGSSEGNAGGNPEVAPTAERLVDA